MDPVTSTVMAGLITNSLWSILRHMEVRGREALGLGEEETGVAGKLREAAAAAAESLDLGDGERGERLRSFLTSPEAEAIVRQIYASQLSSGRNGDDLQSIHRVFLASLSLHLREPQDALQQPAEALFSALLGACDRALDACVEEGVLSAHEAKSAARHHVILDELAAIRRNADFLTAVRRPDVGAILDFEAKYRQQVGDRHRTITPPHFDAARKVPIDDLYVPPDFVVTPTEKGREPSSVALPRFLSTIYRAVLLGNPGGGKSVLTLKLCHDLSTHYSERLFAGRQVTPILVILRDYGAQKKARNCSILDFIESTANSWYQLQPPPGAFEYLLLNGRALVIFDGLDELLETSYRQEISDDVQSFCTLYPSVPVLVTSREVGYEQAPLDRERFGLFRLAPFNDAQVGDYASKWFKADPELTDDQQKQKAQGFLEESGGVSDLRRNPLMLALMCNIYRGEGYIPKNRPEVYEKCAIMLFERWDKRRGILVPLAFEEHISPTMKHLAHWIYSDEELQAGVTEDTLIKEATNYLCPRRFDDQYQAERAAREFIDFCTGRAWVFTDTGVNKEGDRLYQFTHRTFLEYFTAAYLVRTHPTPDSLAPALRPRIAKREWDVVAQLAFQQQHKAVEGAGDELLTGLVKEASTAEEDPAWNLLSFAARCLEFMVPSPKVTRSITLACADMALAWCREHLPGTGDVAPSGDWQPTSVIADLLYAATENRPTIADTLENRLAELINTGEQPDAVPATEIALAPQMVARRTSGGAAPKGELDRLWIEVQQRILNRTSERLPQLCAKHLGLSILAFYTGTATVASIAAQHGAAALFRPAKSRVFPTTWWVSLADHHTYWITAGDPSMPPGQSAKYLAGLRDIGRVLQSVPPPWVRLPSQPTEPRPSPFVFARQPESDRTKAPPASETLDLDPDALFGAFALCAAACELEEDPKDGIRAIGCGQGGPIDVIWALVGARFEEVPAAEVQSRMDRCGFGAKQQALVWRWIRREIDLVCREP